MRFLTALASLKNGRTLLDGNERMRQRPILALLEGLEALGVRAYSRNGDGCPPVVVESRGLRGGSANIRGDQSSQFLSALLMVAPYAEREVHLNVTGPLVFSALCEDDAPCDVHLWCASGLPRIPFFLCKHRTTLSASNSIALKGMPPTPPISFQRLPSPGEG